MNFLVIFGCIFILIQVCRGGEDLPRPPVINHNRVDRCLECNGVRFMFECHGMHYCPRQSCYLQIYEDNVGQIIYGGCAYDNECSLHHLSQKRASPRLEYVSNVALVDHNNKFLCGGCCNDSTACNMGICGLPLLGLYTGSAATTTLGASKSVATNPPSTSTTTVSITSSAATTTPTTTTTLAVATPSPVVCEVCNGPLCGIVPGQSSLCSVDKPYCMNTVHNLASGEKHITKGCASVSDCHTKWLHVTSTDTNCAKFDIHGIYPFDFTCNYCCINGNCNTDIRPDENSLYGLHPLTNPTSHLTPQVTSTLPPITSTVSTTTTTSAAATTSVSTMPIATTPSPVQCEICSGPLCGIVPGQVSLCPVDKPYCLNTVHNTVSGQKLITKGCASVTDCDTKWLHGSYEDTNCGRFDITNTYPFDFICDYCCTSSNCNKDVRPPEKTLFGIDHQSKTTVSQALPVSLTTTTTTTSTTQTTTYMTTTPSPVECEICDGPLCGIVPNPPTMCTADKPYCMNTVHNTVSGQKIITKACSSVQDCDSKFLHGSYEDSQCGSFDVRNTYPFDFTCNYCCTHSHCNQNVRPSESSLYGIIHHTTLPTSTVTSSSLPSTTSSNSSITPAECEICNGTLCGVVPSNNFVRCTTAEPYCMNTVVNLVDGSKLITKSCSSVNTCATRWIKDTSANPVCINYDVTKTHTTEYTCDFCCTADRCNTKIYPSHSLVSNKLH